MSSIRFRNWYWLIITAVAGCAAVRPPPPVPDAASLTWSELAAAPSPDDSAAREMAGNRSGSGAQILVLSSGGLNGAFPAGVLVGWSAAGTRPVFDVVTGVSVGALLAPYAFLGTEFDVELERQYASLTTEPIYRRRAYITLPWAESWADAEPLRQRIAMAITPELLTRIAVEHRRGRRLYVATTNIDTRRSVVWDLGEIAAGTNPDKLALFRTVLLASCSVPALLPPVPITVEIDGERYAELHTDGSVAASLFLPPHVLGSTSLAEDQQFAAAAVYVLIAGKLVPEAKPTPLRWWNVVDASLRGIMHAQMENELQRVFALTQATGSQFYLLGIPASSPIAENPIASDAAAAATLFEQGRRCGAANGPWQTMPPGAAPAEWPRPRTDVRFVTAPAE